jgi:tetratricopeptide (TPR) repeat protein
MTSDKQNISPADQKNDRKRMIVAITVIACGLLFNLFLARWIDVRRPAPNVQEEEERLYLTGNTLRRASLGFNGLAADWYWMRSLQYVGRKFLKAGPRIQLDNLSQLNLKLLAPLLEMTTTLDPEFQEPYEYAAVVLPAIDVQEAIRITKKGIAVNPSAWRLYQHLGYIYWQQRDFKSASEAYGQGAALPGAPAWMQAMKARMAAEGGSRNLAREIYFHIYEQAGDPAVKEMARGRLLQLNSLDQRDLLRKVLLLYKAKAGRCAVDWKDVQQVLRSLRVQVDSAGAPLDPSGKPYVLVSNDCEVDLNSKSEIPRGN